MEASAAAASKRTKRQRKLWTGKARSHELSDQRDMQAVQELERPARLVCPRLIEWARASRAAAAAAASVSVEGVAGIGVAGVGVEGVGASMHIVGNAPGVEGIDGVLHMQGVTGIAGVAGIAEVEQVAEVEEVEEVAKVEGVAGVAGIAEVEEVAEVAEVAKVVGVEGVGVAEVAGVGRVAMLELTLAYNRGYQQATADQQATAQDMEQLETKRMALYQGACDELHERERVVLERETAVLAQQQKLWLAEPFPYEDQPTTSHRVQQTESPMSFYEHAEYVQHGDNDEQAETIFNMLS